MILTLISIALILGCSNPDNKPNQFSSANDKLAIKTEQVKGFGLMYYLGAIIPLKFKDSLNYEVIVPLDLKNIKYANELVDYNILGYQRTIAKGKKDNKYYKNLILESKIDTSNLPSYKDNSICIIEGIKGKDTVFIIDQNNNKDFRDDSIRFWKNIDIYSKRDLIKVNYKIFNNKEYVTSSNWINIGIWNEEKRYFASQYYVGSFSIDSSNYKVEISIPENRFNFNNPKIALVFDNGIVKDTILESQILNIGEVLKLKEGYYRFSGLTNDGSYLTLIKEDDLNSHIGTQVGMIAPDFKGKSYSDDTINLKQLLNKPLLVANISGCTPSSYDVYENILKKCDGKITILGIESGIHRNLGGILIDVENPFNKDLYNKYRKAYSSYDCFLINSEGRIIDKFTLFNWQSRLDPFLDSLNIN
jgi:hypothetical protein